MWRGYPFTAQISASDTPVLPPVYSTTEPPDLRRPSISAASIMASAIRSFMLPVGFSLSIFRRIREPLLGTICRNGSKVVLPMQSKIVGCRFFTTLVQFDPTGGDEASLSVLHDCRRNARDRDQIEMFFAILLKGDEELGSHGRKGHKIWITHFVGLCRNYDVERASCRLWKPKAVLFLSCRRRR